PRRCLAAPVRASPVPRSPAPRACAVTRAVAIRWLAGVTAVALVATAGRAAQAQPPRRLALIVGADGAPPGRRRLRYSHEDARRVAEVLVGAAGFDGGDVSVLLDPQ